METLRWSGSNEFNVYMHIPPILAAAAVTSAAARLAAAVTVEAGTATDDVTAELSSDTCGVGDKSV